MNEHTVASELLYVLSCPPALEERVVDWLLERGEAQGFTSSTAHGHSSDPAHLSVAEKVSGKQRRVQFQVQIAGADLESFTDALRLEFRGADLHYWVIPVALSGSTRNL
jgi:hypothetical protein